MTSSILMLGLKTISLLLANKKGNKMKFNTNKIIAVAALALTLACSDTRPQAAAENVSQTPIVAETKESKVAPAGLEADVKPVVEEFAKPVVEEFAKPVVEEPAKPMVEKVSTDSLFPKGTNCKLAFSKEDLGNALIKGEAYVAPESHYGVNPAVDHAFEMAFAYNEGKLIVTANVAHEKKVCLKGASEGAVLVVKFEGDDLFYRAAGLHDRSCGTAKKITDRNAALGVYEIPVNSLLFKKALTQKVQFFGVQATKGVIIGSFLEDGSSKFRNGFRCAHEALGDQFDLSNDSRLINNSFKADK